MNHASRFFKPTLLAVGLLLILPAQAQERERERDQAEARIRTEQRMERARAEEREAAEQRERAEREQMEQRERAEREQMEQRERRMQQEGPLNQDLAHFLETQGLGHVIGELRELQRQNPEAFRDRLEEVHQHVRAYHELREIAPEIAEQQLEADRLEYEARQLAAGIRHTEQSERREAMFRELHGALERIFEIRMGRAEWEVHRMERELDKQREMLHRRAEARGEIIERRMRQLVEEQDILGWW